jgi:hypothetical protein
MWGKPGPAVHRAFNPPVPMMPEEIQPDHAGESEARSSSDVISLESHSASATLTEDLALAHLKDHGLSADIVEQITKSDALMKSRKVRVACASHPRAPRRLTLRLIRELYTFDLMQFSQIPSVAADLKRFADELLVARLASITLGERISLARRASAMVAAALLLDRESRVWQTALENPRVAEASIVKALQRTNAMHSSFVKAVCQHIKWSVRPEIRMALLRNEHTPLARALEFARRLPPAQLRDVLHASRLPEKIKAYLQRDLESRGHSGKASI